MGGVRAAGLDPWVGSEYGKTQPELDPLPFLNSIQIWFITIRGVGWVGFKGFFNPIHHGGSKKIQSNLTHHINPA